MKMSSLSGENARRIRMARDRSAPARAFLALSSAHPRCASRSFAPPTGETDSRVSTALARTLSTGRPGSADARRRASLDWRARTISSCPVRPTKILCIGRNYAAHARELGHEVPSEPLLFLKPPSALLGPGGAVVLPPESARVEHEAELAVVVGRRAKNVSARRRARARLRLLVRVRRDRPRSAAQGRAVHAREGVRHVLPRRPVDRDGARSRAPSHVRCRVNGATRQDGTTAHMIFDVPTIVSYASRMMTLEPGDVILTGTPEGVGPLLAGDALEVEVGGIGTLKLRVAT